MEEYTIYTDGACDNMSQLEGGAWVFLDVRNGKVFNKKVGFQRIATNNQMELRAIFEVFLYVSPNSKVHIITDSKYCIGMLSQGWKPKANHALIARIKQIIEDKNLTVEFEWVKGHSGDYFNEMADTLANNEYKKLPKLIEKFADSVDRLWHLENKTAGAGIEDIRLGGLARRAKHCRELILEHVKNGKEIAELKDPMLDFYIDGVKGHKQPIRCCEYDLDFSVNVLMHGRQ